MYEEIIAEIERLKDKYKYLSSVEAKHKTDCYCDILSFIESLPGPSEDLQKAAEEYSFDSRPSIYGQVDVIDAFIAGAQWQEEKEREYSPWLSIPGLKDASLEFAQQAKDYEIGGQTWTEDMAVAFTRGAEWQKEQMMKDAKVAEIGYWNQRGLSIRTEQAVERMPYDEGDKVKIIIVKEDAK